MKKINLFLVASLLLTVASCSKDDGGDLGEANDAAINAAEDVELDINTVSEGIAIEGATRKTGTLEPNSTTLTFDAADKKQSAFISNGFDIAINVPETYAGAYLQVVKDGTVAKDYLEIPLGAGDPIKVTKTKGALKSISSKMNDQQVNIDVNFGDAIPPGKFCYLLCIYDDAGNISQPTEICVEVEAWGGNSKMVATWELFKTEYTYRGETEIEEINVEICEDYTFFCNATQESVIVKDGDCETLLLSDLVLNEDGTYIFNDRSEGKIVNYEVSSASTDCTAVIEDDIDTYYSKGNWAFDEEEGKLTLVEFEWREDEEPLEIEEDGDLLFNAEVEFNDNTFILRDNDENSPVDQRESFVGFFRKK